MKKTQAKATVEEKAELNEFISDVVSEIRRELGPQASIHAIEAALLQRQSQIMSRMMEDLAKDQDFPPSGHKG